MNRRKDQLNFKTVFKHPILVEEEEEKKFRVPKKHI
jgi:hypothetical protein